MSGDDDYTPLHWQPDIGGAQAEENLRLLEWAQSTREERLGDDTEIPGTEGAKGTHNPRTPDSDPAEPEPPDPARGHGCAR